MAGPTFTRVTDVSLSRRHAVGLAAAAALGGGGRILAPPKVAAQTAPKEHVGGGRPLPLLAFVTSQPALDQLGLSSEGLRRALPTNHRLVVFENVVEAETAVQSVRPALRRSPTPSGVVLIGGYDTLPPRRVLAYDCTLAPLVDVSGDADRFYVWNDDLYGDVDGDDLAELPVSRIPCYEDEAMAVEGFWRALRATNPGTAPPRPKRRGVRAPELLFADGIYNELPASPGDGPMLVVPTTSDDKTAPKSDENTAEKSVLVGSDKLVADRLYLALHGLQNDASAFSGGNQTVLDVSSVPDDADGMVVVAATCWGALIVDQPASKYVNTNDTGLTARDPSRSIALAFVAKGANAFVGFTGFGYVPTTPESYAHFAQPLHEAFWHHYDVDGLPPAQALFKAKADYIAKVPHANSRKGLSEAQSTAIEMKVYWSATCLGLGW